MDELQGTAVIIALFALRCVAPLTITMLLGYLMNRLVDRWRAEDEAREFDEAIPGLDPEASAGIKLPTISVPCWILRNCNPDQQAECPAKQNPGLPCWLVRMRLDGKLPEGCPDCVIYNEGSLAVA